MDDERKPQVFGNRWVGAAGSADGGGQIMDSCGCIAYVSTRPQGPTRFHSERQDTTASGWLHLLELIEEAAADRREVFKPLVELTAEQRREVVTLPSSIASLTAVKHLVLYRSNLVRIPPEIGAMRSLEEFTSYTSYRLHWFPYEITRCPGLRCSTVSTRAVYGNFKRRPPFPQLPSTRRATAARVLCTLGRTRPVRATDVAKEHGDGSTQKAGREGARHGLLALAAVGLAVRLRMVRSYLPEARCFLRA